MILCDANARVRVRRTRKFGSQLTSISARQLTLAVDVCIFIVQDRQLKLRLVRRSESPYRGRWALPGTVVAAREDLEETARRALAEETGAAEAYLEQLYTVAKPSGDSRRAITVVYFALTAADKIQIRATAAAEAAGWFGMHKLPGLAADHADMVRMARRRLVAKLDYSTIALQFMPKRFTLSDLQSVYEIILGETLDKRNFRKRILAFDQIEETKEKRRGGVHRPARLYRVRRPDKVAFIK